MLIGSRQRVANKELCVSIGGNVLTQVNSVRYLGVLIDPVLSWPCILIPWLLELCLDLVQFFVMGHCHLHYCVCYTQLL